MAYAHNTSVSKIKRALLSVSDKNGIVALAHCLTHLNIEILSTGGTAHLLKENHIPVTDVAAYTNYPEIMDGRVKTLHPKIAGGILGRREMDADIMAKLNIDPIDLVVVNLYPFEKVTSVPTHSLQDAIENIDIGGPTLIRSAAKNYAYVGVVTSPADYPLIQEELNAHGFLSEPARLSLMKKAFAYTAQYDALIANYFSHSDEKKETTLFPDRLSLHFEKKQDLRYGENPHQQAALYIEPHASHAGIGSAKQLQGKALSFNNIVDADTATQCVLSFDEPACVIVKHANPCGVAISDTLLGAYERAFKTDPTSAYGGIIAFNRSVDDLTAATICRNQFVEVIIAPLFTKEAVAIFAEKKNVRLLEMGQLKSHQGWDYKRIPNGLLVQTWDNLSHSTLECVTTRQPSAQELKDLTFAWTVAKFVKSNAIVYAKAGMTIGIGAGQMSRVVSAKIAELKALDEHLSIQGSVMASDAFLPFRDSVDTAAKACVSAIIQPGGSIRDEEVIAAANEHDIAMVYTGIRHFRH